MTQNQAPTAGTADLKEIATFAAIADAWWDPKGKFRPLHQINPVRIGFIRDQAIGHFGLDPNGAQPFKGLSLLDIGSGGGLLSEPMTRLGATVTGIDAAERNIEVAKLHADTSGLAIDYRCQLPEDLAKEGKQFDIVLNMEVVEHVADMDVFLGATADLIKPGGMMVIATLNRTLKSLALAKIGAEYILRWLPAGTHDWRKFVKPSELGMGLKKHGITIKAINGMVYQPFRDEWAISDTDLDVNYLAYAVKEK